MAVTYGFYDSLNHDRLYNAQQMSAIFDGIINDGVFMSVGNQFHTVAGTGMQVIVKSGRAWFDSTWTLNDAEYPLSIDAADVLLTRIDAVVLEVNSEVATRANTIKVVKGTPASTPAKPTLTNTATIHQHALAYVTVAKNTTAITNSMIEIVVGKTETPYVTAILQTTDITDLFKKWENDFQVWFDTVRSTLDGDVALNLQNQITSLDRKMLLPSTPPKIGLPNSATGDDMFNVLCKVGDLHVWEKKVKTDDAGYNLESSKSGYLASGSSENSNNNKFTVYYSSSISISKEGIPTLVSPENVTYAYNRENSSGLQNRIRGKFINIIPNLYAGYPQTAPIDIIFIPSDAIVSYDGSGLDIGYPNNYCYIVNKMQIVQPYGIKYDVTYPVSTDRNAYQEENIDTLADTIIKYVGCLGNKSRTQMVKYVGTGVSGSGYETKIPFDFRPKLLVIAIKDSGLRTIYISILNSNTGLYLSADNSTTIYGSSSSKISYIDGKVQIGAQYANSQMNSKDKTYIAVAFD